MSAQLSAHGRLVADVQLRQTGKGTPMAFTRMAVSLPCHRAEEGQETFWLAVVAFGRIADALARHKKTDMLSVSGVMQITHWAGQDGIKQTGYQIVADSVVSARTVRPGGGVKAASTGRSEPPAPSQDDTGDTSVADAARNWELYQTGSDGDAFDQRAPFDET